MDIVRTNYVLIDYENVQPDSFSGLEAEHFRIILFVGSHQTKLSFEIVDAIQKFGTRGQYVKMTGNGPNALDFHIAYYIGHLSSQDSRAFFHIISKDTGFDPLIQHLKTKQVPVIRSAAIEDIPLLARTRQDLPNGTPVGLESPIAVVNAPAVRKQPLCTSCAPSAQATKPNVTTSASAQLSARMEVAVAGLKKCSKNAPKTLTALSHMLASLLKDQCTSKEVAELMIELQRRKLVVVNDSTVSYKLPKQ